MNHSRHNAEDHAPVYLSAGRVVISIMIALVICGCASSPTQSYPVPKMLDPVTEEVPNVIR